MASVVILATALPASAQVGPGLGRTDVVSRPQSYAKVCTKDTYGRLSIRTRPGQNFAKIGEVRNGSLIPLMRGQYSRDGFYWWNISHNGIRGWVRADYVCGDPQ
ncbi:SH3 domain-containing protein [Calothrix sp. FACHB-1219]|nr:SH3 domain-containing protein [Calothrix sp. FACHB-168]MBD2220352.1 SH3 domain-containing protein [Calothrix sp. FACHB-1219]